MKIPLTSFHIYSPNNERNVADRQRREAAPQPIVMVTPPAPRRHLGFAFGAKLHAPRFDINRLADAGIMNRVGEMLADDGANRSLANLRKSCSGMQAHVFETLTRQRVSEMALNVQTAAEAHATLHNIGDLSPGDRLRPLAILMFRMSASPHLFTGVQRAGVHMAIDNEVAMLGRDDLRQRFVFEVLRHADKTKQPIPKAVVQRLLWKIRSLTTDRQEAPLEELFDLQTARPGTWIGVGILNDIEALPPGVGTKAKGKVRAYREQQAAAS